MTKWLSSLSKSARIGLVISIVWVIGWSSLTFSEISFAGFIILGVLPVIVGWGFRYIGKGKDEQK